MLGLINFRPNLN